MKAMQCAYLDECGVCGGDGIADGECDCDGNVEDALECAEETAPQMSMKMASATRGHSVHGCGGLQL